MHVNLPDKRYYKIGEVSKAFGVNASLIRFWENEFKVIKPKKNEKGDRMFTKEDIRNFKIIYNLVKERGYTLEGAKQRLKQSPDNLIKNQEIITKLEAIKQALIDIKKQLEN